MGEKIETKTRSRDLEFVRGVVLRTENPSRLDLQAIFPHCLAAIYKIADSDPFSPSLRYVLARTSDGS